MIADVAVVTGASGGIGRSIALASSRLSHLTVLVGRDRKRLDDAAAACEGSIQVVVADIRDATALQDLADQFAQMERPRIAIVAGAGVPGPIHQPGLEDPNEWSAAIGVNLIGTYQTVFPFLALMRSTGWGRIVMVSSAQTLHGPDPIMTAYATSKMALNAYTACLSAYFEGSEISACAIHPGDIYTDMGAEIEHKATTAGPIASHLVDWAKRTSIHGGDDPAEAGELVTSIMERPAKWSNGRFLRVPSSIDRHPSSAWSIEVGPAYEAEDPTGAT